VVLFGQPELDSRLGQDSVRQLRQRITFHYRLRGLHGDEVRQYLAHRLRVAGYEGEALFGDRAARLIARASGGVPRLVNILAHKAMLSAYGEGAAQVLPRHVRAAAEDTPAVRRWSPPWEWFGIAAALAVVTVAGLVVLP
jgi:MSHA biogenesis protein MshM